MLFVLSSRCFFLLHVGFLLFLVFLCRLEMAEILLVFDISCCCNADSHRVCAFRLYWTFQRTIRHHLSSAFWSFYTHMRLRWSSSIQPSVCIFLCSFLVFPPQLCFFWPCRCRQFLVALYFVDFSFLTTLSGWRHGGACSGLELLVPYRSVC